MISTVIANELPEGYSCVAINKEWNGDMTKMAACCTSYISDVLPLLGISAAGIISKGSEGIIKSDETQYE